MDGWKDVEPEQWKPVDEGDNIIGVLVQKEPKDVDKELSAQYILENIDGMWLVWGSAVLDKRMALVKVGQTVKITFKGTKENNDKKKNDIKIFKVEVKEEPQSGGEVHTVSDILNTDHL